MGDSPTAEEILEQIRDRAENRRQDYGVPRRYDLSTMFVVCTACALLFATMNAWDCPVEVALFVGFFLLCIGAGQALLSGGKNPRRASWFVGFFFGFASVLISAWLREGPLRGTLLSFPGALMWGLCVSFFGYLAGVFIGGVFLIADLLRKACKLTSHDGRQ